MKFIFKLIKRIVLSFAFLYCLNLIIYQAGFILPINIYSIGLMVLFGIPGLIPFIFIHFII